jgi:hypothetical protein
LLVQGIQDKTIVERTYRGEDATDKAEAAREIQELKLACILNLSMCYWKLREWTQCIRACDRALELDPSNTKALYRRAQARIVPASCGTTDNLLALADLKKAVSLKPDDSMLTSAYAELKITLSEQKKKDKKTFSNLFERKDRSGSWESAASGDGETDGVATTNPTGHSNASSSSSAVRKPTEEKKKQLTWQDAFDMVRDMQAAAERCEAEGRPAQAAAILAKKDELQKQMMVYFPKNVQAEMERADLEGRNLGGDVLPAAAASGGGAGRKKKGKGGSAAAAGEGAGTSRPSSSRETTAAGGEGPASWYEAVGASEYDLVDFSKPTPSMIRDAQSKGLDLTDVRCGLILLYCDAELNVLTVFGVIGDVQGPAVDAGDQQGAHQTREGRDGASEGELLYAVRVCGCFSFFFNASHHLGQAGAQGGPGRALPADGRLHEGGAAQHPYRGGGPHHLHAAHRRLRQDPAQNAGHPAELPAHGEGGGGAGERPAGGR